MQEFALELTLLAEARDKGKEALHDFKMAVVSANPEHFIPIVFPEWQSVPSEEEVTDEELTDTDGGEYIFTNPTPLTQEEIDAHLADLMAGGGMDMTMSEAEQFDPDW